MFFFKDIFFNRRFPLFISGNKNTRNMEHEIFHRDMFLNCQLVREMHCGCILKVFGYKDRMTEGQKPAVTNDCIFKNHFSLFRKTRFLCCKGVIFFHFFHFFHSFLVWRETLIIDYIHAQENPNMFNGNNLPKREKEHHLPQHELWIPPVRFLFFFDEKSIIDVGSQKSQRDRSFKT